jgi:hypothetical protein
MRMFPKFLLVLACAMPPAAQAVSTVVDLAADGGLFRFLYVAPDSPSAVTASILSISGGDGFLDIANDGTMDSVTARCGPLTRNREAVAARGIALALMNSPPSPGQVVAVDAWLRQRHAVPTWLSGGSAATAAVAFHAANAPASMAGGVLFFAPGQLPAATLAAITRPTLVISHAGDGASFSTQVFAGLTNVQQKERIVVTGGVDTPPCGIHLFWGADTAFLDGVAGFIARNNAPAAERKHQALWYAAPGGSEGGWGVNLTHQGDTLFATWFTYDAEGPMWLVMSNGARVAANRYQGALYRTTGPAFDSVPFDPARVGRVEVGTATFDFAGADNATFSYSVNGVSQSKAITRQVFASPLPECFGGGTPSASNFQDLWWNPSESGWGVNLTHQGDILFGTWFTYARDGKGQWLVMSRMDRVGGSATRFAGPVYRTGGASFAAYDPARFSIAAAGTAAFDFSGPSDATFTYTLDGVTQSKAITRQVFSTPTSCR